jgi:hypothetical protein
MKYVIPNERLNKFMTDNLNNFMDSCEVSKFDSFITLSKEVQRNFNNTYKDVLIEYDYKDGRLYIDMNTLRNFNTWFPIFLPDAEKFIKDWFEKTFNVKVSHVS